MKVEQMKSEIFSQNTAIDQQQTYIIQLEQLEEAGQSSIDVYDAKFSRNTQMSMASFIALQQQILDDMVPFRDSLQALYDKFQNELDAMVNESESKTVPAL